MALHCFAERSRPRRRGLRTPRRACGLQNLPRQVRRRRYPPTASAAHPKVPRHCTAPRPAIGAHAREAAPRISMQDGPVGRILYTGLPRRTIIPLRGSLLSRCSHLPACLDGAALRGRRPRMPVDVAPGRGCRVSPAMPPPVTGRRDTEMAVPVRVAAPAPQTRLWLFLDIALRRRRTAVSRYPALWSPDLPRWIRIHRDRPARLALRILVHPRLRPREARAEASCDNTR